MNHEDAFLDSGDTRQYSTRYGIRRLQTEVRLHGLDALDAKAFNLLVTSPISLHPCDLT